MVERVCANEVGRFGFFDSDGEQLHGHLPLRKLGALSMIVRHKVEDFPRAGSAWSGAPRH